MTPDHIAELNFRKAIRNLTYGRVVILTCLLGATVFFGTRANEPNIGVGPAEGVFYALVGSVYCLSLIYAVAMKLARSLTSLVRLAYVQLTFDAVFGAVLVLVTGGTGSVFTFFFSLSILLAATILYRTGALYVATVSSGLFLTIGMVDMRVLGNGTWLERLQMAGISRLDPLGDGAHLSSMDSISYNIFINVVAFYAIAFLSSYLADHLRRTDLKLEENRVNLEDLKALHANIVSSIQSALITVNHSQQVTFFNSVAEQITGLQSADVLYQDIRNVFTDLKQIFQNEDKLMSQHEELTCQLLRGKIKYLRWTISPLMDSRGNRIGHVLICNDVTRVRDMETEMTKADRFATLGKFAASIAHEIRNPLAAISGSIQLMNENLNLPPDEERLFQIVSREADALNQWLTDFLTYARPRMGERIRVNLGQMLSDSLLVLMHDEHSSDIEVDKDLSSDAHVLADPVYLKQVVWNILNNSLQAMPEGGNLGIACQPIDDPRGEFHRITFSDSGSGIPRDVIDRVFEPFYTTKTGGTGLGLATVFRIVGEHGGFVGIKSGDGKGTHVTVDLPRFEG